MMKLPLKGRISRRTVVRASIPVLALALIASVVVGRERPTEVTPEPARAPVRIDSRAALDQDLDLSKLHREIAEAKVEPANDPFARRSFGPAGQPQAAAPQAPTAPQLPFRYLGKAIEDGKLTVFLMKGNDSYAVHSKQALDNEYRVDKVTETQVVFTYVPLKQKQTLDIPVTQ